MRVLGIDCGTECTGYGIVEMNEHARDEIAPTSRATAEVELLGHVNQSRRQVMAIDVAGDREPARRLDAPTEAELAAGLGR